MLICIFTPFRSTSDHYQVDQHQYWVDLIKLTQDTAGKTQDDQERYSTRNQKTASSSRLSFCFVGLLSTDISDQLIIMTY